MAREEYASIYATMGGEGTTDYEKYLRTHELLALQKPFEALANPDELQFQITHQASELWMKLIAYTLLEILPILDADEVFKALTLFGRVHRAQGFLTDQIQILETMAPKDYQEIRLHLGAGSGQESPGFRALTRIAPLLWRHFEAFLKRRGLTVPEVYDTKFRHDAAYMLAEALAEFDERFVKFRFVHLQLIRRSIGLGAKSLRGQSTKLLEDGLAQAFYPALWNIRNQMTDRWGQTYGEVREHL